MCRCSTPREKHNFVYFCIHTWVFNCPSLMQVSQNCPDLGVFFTRAFGSLSPGVSQQEQSCATQPGCCLSVTGGISTELYRENSFLLPWWCYVRRTGYVARLPVTGGGGYHWQELAQVSFLLRQKFCRDRRVFCCDKK